MASLEKEIPVGNLSLSESKNGGGSSKSSSSPLELRVMVAGPPRSGKSTGLNNIFDLKLPAKLCPTPVTTEVTTVNTTKNGVSLTVTDVPGLSAASTTDDHVVLRDVTNLGIQNTFLLILTLPVSQGSSITDGYQKILENLTTIFGTSIWDWCLVLLTFSDKIRENEFSKDVDEQKYLDYLKDHCTVLQEVLVKQGVEKPVKLFFEYVSFKQFRDQKFDGIVAIPVGAVPEISTKRLFPLQPWTHPYQWTDLAMMTLTKLNKNIPQASRLRSALIQLRYGLFTVKEQAKAIGKAAVGGAAGGVLLGGATGAGIGGVSGFAAGPFGTALGVLVGGGIGVITGGIVGAASLASGAVAITMINHKLELQRKAARR